MSIFSVWVVWIQRVSPARGYDSVLVCALSARLLMASEDTAETWLNQL